MLSLLSPAHGARAAAAVGLPLSAASQICARYGFHAGGIAAAVALLASAATAACASPSKELDPHAVGDHLREAVALAVHSDDLAGLVTLFNATAETLRATRTRGDSARIIVAATLQGAADALAERDTEDGLESPVPPSRLITLQNGCSAALKAYAPVVPLELSHALLGASNGSIAALGTSDKVSPFVSVLSPADICFLVAN